MAGKFEIKETAKGGYMFNLKAGNGQVIATSESYVTLDACEKGIESVRKNSQAAVEDQTVAGFEKLAHPKYEVYTDKAGETRFRLKATNGQIIVTGESYRSKASCLKGIASIKNNAPEAKVVHIN